MSSGWPRFADSPRQFVRYLRELKKRGSNLLITGDVPDTVTARATQTLFGEGDRRYRVLALLDTTSRIPDSLSVADDRLWVVERAGEKRSARPSASSDVSVRETDDMDGIRREIGAAADFYDDEFDGLDPAELRIGVDLGVRDDRDSIREFVEGTAEIVADHRGMAHYHLPKPDDDPLVDELSPLFDARIELRQVPGQPPEQRWHVPAFDKTTIWVRL
ncbi:MULTISPECIES: DUF7504 family protein [Haladaptatus]|uniref:Uncharacterized protein n=1 Tax=Haladaptatus paucihalophilus DX253 TaxID=797209 RepID=A0A1M6YG67_HALPU|nr:MULTISPECIES: hypothetical protein [Haladaptatus]GKZ15775.1 hypothetical protein HAL_36560 [Haladaptatus sp. T7]SHL17321.1 hypothetical protein SAMN05444342_3128 [Haladaptatus paucihalophilus DX253]